MRPNQNRRMRGRNRSKGPNPLTRAYESNGPDVKIRGTAQHIAEKYAQLARDAQASGDPVMAENYFQHGEHYQRIIAAANEQYRQQFGGFGRGPFDDEGDEGDDEGPQANGYAAGGPEGRGPNGYAPNGYGHGGEDYVDPSQQPQPYESRGEPDNRPARFDRQDRRERFQNRDRPQRQDRQDRPPQERDHQQRDHQRQDFRGEPQRQEFRGENRGEFRRERPRREEPRAEAPPAEEPGLPAFLTNPARPPAPAAEPAPVPAPAAEAAGEAPARPRRRRRTRYEGAPGEAPAEGGGELFPPKTTDAPSE
ncbi:hypothetical protein GMJLKIPL_6304 [Methylobacterium isbiliense]|uniref:DUF4167 domain-containing protein n=3 Tax=Methylobacterium TaxID=407 RepID=A0ABQ4SR92_9HYPH|nr:hypothetical protein GMJLKIPL_6304 [Methylobacterium isbiliense]